MGANGVPSGTPTPAPYGSERDRRAIPEAIRAPRAGFALGVRQRNRDDYYRALRSADASGDYTEWMIYFLGGFAYQMVRVQELARSGAKPKASSD